MGFLNVHAIEVNDGQLLRENDSVRVETSDDRVWYGTINGITVFDTMVEVTVTNDDGADIQVDSDCIVTNDTQEW